MARFDSYLTGHIVHGKYKLQNVVCFELESFSKHVVDNLTIVKSLSVVEKPVETVSTVATVATVATVTTVATVETEPDIVATEPDIVATEPDIVATEPDIVATEPTERPKTAKNPRISENTMFNLIKSLKDLSIEDGLNLLKEKGLTVNTTIGDDDDDDDDDKDDDGPFFRDDVNSGDSIISYTILNRQFDEQNINHIIKMMVYGGADPNKYHPGSSSPLNNWTFHTLYNKIPRQICIDSIELLLKAGANPNVKPVNRYYYDPYASLLKYVANSEVCNEQIIEMFLKHGAKMTLTEEQEIEKKTNPYVKYLYKKRIEEAVKQAKQEVMEELYTPGGVGYGLAKMHFENSSNLKIE